MLKAVLIDDETHCINMLQGLLESCCRATVEVKGAFQSFEEGLAAVVKVNPDLVFLDVELGNKTGFDLLKALPEISFDVIFTTAYDKYAVQAFKFSAVDYLLKPIDEELQQAIQKIETKHANNEMSKKLEALLYNIRHLSDTNKRICLPVGNNYTFVPVADIVRCEGSVNYTTVFLRDKQKFLIAKTLKEFDDLLKEHNFFRVHHSHLVNLACIKIYNKGRGSVVLLDNTEIGVSTRRKDELLKQLKQ